MNSFYVLAAVVLLSGLGIMGVAQTMPAEECPRDTRMSDAAAGADTGVGTSAGTGVGAAGCGISSSAVLYLGGIVVAASSVLFGVLAVFGSLLRRYS